MFITFEGIEGSGKTVQIARAREYLLQRGVPCVVTREPGGTEFGAAVRRVLLQTEGPRREPHSELLLYLADRFQHLREFIQPELERGRTVLCDRYHDATRAYQGAARGVPDAEIDSLSALLGIPEPDATILLDLEAEKSLARARLRNDLASSAGFEGRFEAEDLSFHNEVRRAYLALAKRFAGRFRVVDGSGTPDEVFSAICAHLDRLFPKIA
jgi:dTMP kinase